MKPLKAAIPVLLILALTLDPIYVKAGDELAAISLEVTPEPLHMQLNSGETYTFNLSVTNGELGNIPGEPVDPADGVMRYTGNLTFALRITWRVTGGYHFGGKVTGYGREVDEVELNATIPTPLNGSDAWVCLEHAFERDGFDLGAKPYEAIEVRLRASVHPELYNSTVGPRDKQRGESAAVDSLTLYLVDEEKVEYVEGKLQEMEEELELLSLLPQSETTLDEGVYLAILEEVKALVEDGDYVSALDEYEGYDEKQRMRLLRALIRETNSSLAVLDQFNTLRGRVELLEQSYDLLEERFIEISNAYQGKLGELEAAKQFSTTAITGAFISAVVFFFLGRLSARRGEQAEAEEPTTA